MCRLRQSVKPPLIPPTLFGIMLITFLLFTVAAPMRWCVNSGKITSPAQLEALCKLGINKPLWVGPRGSVFRFAVH